MDELAEENASSTDPFKKTFRKLPEAPVYKPTVEEFADPIAYLSKIRSDVEKIGLCKIIPPTNWQPPFSLDIEKLKFVPRIQRLSELEALTRIKLNFLNQLATFWEMQGSKLKVPIVENHPLNLYDLRKLVLSNGGYYIVTSIKKWEFIATEMEYPAGKCGNILQGHYHNILSPYDVFENNKKKQCKTEMKVGENRNENLSSKLENGEISVVDQRQKNETSCKSKPIKSCKELQRLKIYGAGPKMVGFMQPSQNRKRKASCVEDSLSNYICLFCKKRDYDECMLICTRCEASFHLYCLKPPLLHIPDGDWCCADCTANEIENNTEPFGFLQSEHEYTLQQFGEMAERFKLNYFNMPIQQISSEMIENEYWNIMSSVDSEVTVEYGADLHTIDHGSAFPTKQSINLVGRDIDYANSPWNLNNIPVIEGSILNYLTGDISGIKLPWMYVGMLFSTFCWHNEDHWTYSINYLHWGEAKTWYCVPGEYADKFEKTIMSVASELFEAQPDLLQQLVTQLNPSILIEAGVPVHRIDQYAGEFVVTFPRSYHAGFNQGYNFAEAVNFAPAEWLKMGRQCIQYYSYYQRYCVFSHDELVCKMATNADKLSLTIAAVTYEDLLTMANIEKDFRKELLKWGVRKVERVKFELVPDDARQCSICNTTCFLSAITCKCNLKKLTCFRHYKLLCKCPAEDHILQYRYTMDELPQLLQNVKCKAESFDQWIDKVRDVLVYKKLRISFKDLKNLYLEAITKKFPSCELIEILKSTVDIAEKCINYIEKLETSSSQLTLTELKSVTDEITQLCPLQEADMLKQHISEVEKFQYKTLLLSRDFPENSSTYTSVEFSNITETKNRWFSVQWYNEISKRIGAGKKISMKNLEFYIKIGLNLSKNELNTKIVNDLKSLLSSSIHWENCVKICLESNVSFQNLLTDMRLLLAKIHQIPVELPSQWVLQDTYDMVMDWYKFASKNLGTDLNYKKLNFSTLEMIVIHGKNLPIKFIEMELFEKDFNEAYNWKKRVLDLFAKDSSVSINQLTDLICPRTFVSSLITSTEPKIVTAGQIVHLYNRAQYQEIEVIKKIQKDNLKKISNRLHTSKFCKCNHSKYSRMIQCCLCKNLYHMSCITNYSKEHYLCSDCKRTKRPSMAAVQALLNDLLRINVFIEEGEMLKCLIRRILQWKEQAENIIQKLKNTKYNPHYYTCRFVMSNLLCEGELLEVSDFEGIIMEIRELFKVIQSIQDQNNNNISEEIIDLTCEDENDDVESESIIITSEAQKIPRVVECVSSHDGCKA